MRWAAPTRVQCVCRKSDWHVYCTGALHRGCTVGKETAMSNCPKCGSYKILGPKYESALTHAFHALFAHEREWLRYTCFECNYSTTATLAASDFQPKEQHSSGIGIG